MGPIHGLLPRQACSSAAGAPHSMGHGLEREERVKGLAIGVSIAPVALRLCFSLRTMRGNDVPRPPVNNHPCPHWQIRTIHLASVGFVVAMQAGRCCLWRHVELDLHRCGRLGKRTTKMRGFGRRIHLRRNIPIPFLMVVPRIRSCRVVRVSAVLRERRIPALLSAFSRDWRIASSNTGQSSANGSIFSPREQFARLAAHRAAPTRLAPR